MAQVINALKMAHQLLVPRLSVAYRVVDATAGNGKDTLFLAQNTPNETAIYAFDIQQQALLNSQELLKNHGFSTNKVRYILDSHANVKRHLDGMIDVAMLNLGYLPGASHELTTKPETTVLALDQLAYSLVPGGVMTVVAYPGHASGEIEEKAVRAFLAALPQKSFTVGCWQMINQVNKPPVLYIVEKVRSEAVEGITSCKG